MAKQTTPSKKATAKKTTTKAKPATGKKATAQKSKPIAQAKAKPKTTKAKPKTATAKKATAKTTSTRLPPLPKPSTRRPDPNPVIPQDLIAILADYFNNIKLDLEDYAAHMRALDRSRVNGVGIKRQGFIERAYQLAVENTEFLPHWLTIEKFNDDHSHFVELRSLFDTGRQIQELLWNLIMQSADMVYTDALEFYDSVRSAAKRRIDAAESIHQELKIFCVIICGRNIS